MDLAIDTANHSFVLCGLIVVLGTLLVWAIRTVDQWITHRHPIRIRSHRRE